MQDRGKASPNDLSPLKAYSDMLNYYRRFVPMLTSELQPQHKSLQKNEPWKLGAQQQETFETAKEIKLRKLLECYRKKENLLHSDSWPTEIYAALSLLMEDGSERPWHMHYAR